MLFDHLVMGLLTLMVGEVVLLSFSIEKNLGNLSSIYILISFSDKLFMTIVPSHLGNWSLKGITKLTIGIERTKKKMWCMQLKLCMLFNSTIVQTSEQ